MIVNNIRIKLLAALFLILVFWKITNLLLFNQEKVKLEQNVEKLKAQQVLIKVYYEALCPDSRNFVVKQLVPTFNSIKDYIELQLIPYGKAETIIVGDDYSFKCQHGKTECDANIIHACSINKVSDSKNHLDLIACMIKNNFEPLLALKNCASEMDEYQTILDCSKSYEGRNLLMKYGEMTHNLHPEIVFIPTITLDNDLDNQVLILKNLLRQVCERLTDPPKECKSEN